MLNHLAGRLIALPRPAKRVLALAVDAGLCVLAVWLALYLRLEVWAAFTPAYGAAAVIAVVLALPLFVSQGLYRAIFRYADAQAMAAMARACALFAAAYAVAILGLGLAGVPRSLGILVPLVLCALVMASRCLARCWLGGLYRRLTRHGKALPQVVIYGAGHAGRQLAAALGTAPDMVVRAFVDDSPELQGRTLKGLPIRAPAWLEQGARQEGVTDVLLAMPSVSRGRRTQILNRLVGQQLHVRMLPGMAQLAQGRAQAQDLQEVQVEDLLGRDPVAPEPELLQRHVRGKCVLVTGAGGSIGSELCRQIAALEPATLVLVERTEYALYAIHGELAREFPELNLVPLLASVFDEPRIRVIMDSWRPQTVYHAAAYKHVPLVEHNMLEGVRNNVWGTWVCARMAAEHGVENFVLISTDKAVRPTNVMGATKRLAEMVLQALAQQPGMGTCFTMVRFGNVLGSSGSVVPLFRQQIAQNGPITLTHQDITRYFMTIPEASQLVIQAGAMAHGGDVFVLDMGEPVRIYDLACRMVELSGLRVRDQRNPGGDIEIRITGLRPGEKLYEELLIGDGAQPTSHARIMKAHESFVPRQQLEQELAVLKRAMESFDLETVRAVLLKLVSGYQPANGLVDWVYLADSANTAEMPRPVAA